jgi:putative ABC transport system permease protein
MNIIEYFRLAFASLRERKLRSALTILGLVIGPAVIVALVAATTGFSLSVQEQFNKMGVTTIMVMPATQSVKLTDADVQIIQRMHDVAHAMPFYMIAGTVKNGGKVVSMSLIAMETSKLTTLMPDLKLAEGKLPGTADVAGAVIGYSLSHPSDPDMKPIRLYEIITAQVVPSGGQKALTRSFLVEGGLASFGQGIFLNPDQTIFVSLITGRMLTKSTHYTGIYVIASTSDKVSGVIDAITNRYGDDVRVIAISSILNIIQTITGGISIILSSVAFISVIVAFIGIMTTMFTTVVERTREIGLLKALGYKKRDVLMVFLSESILTGLIGGIIGAVLGYGLSFGIVSFFKTGFSFQGGGQVRGLGQAGGQGMGAGAMGGFLDFTPVISPELIALAIFMSLGVGALAGMIPAWRASKLDPVVALRKE